jgi:hypothetical protein
MISCLVNDIVPKVEQLSDDLVGLATDSIVVHDIGCESLASLDLLCCLARVVIVDIHLKLAPLVKKPADNLTDTNSHLLDTRLRIQEPHSY